jgi:hypothetical protein
LDEACFSHRSGIASAEGVSRHAALVCMAGRSALTRPANSEPFLIVVADYDRKMFTVSTPLTDGTWEITHVCEEQRKGRAINCHTVPAAVGARERTIDDFRAKGFAYSEMSLLS